MKKAPQLKMLRSKLCKKMKKKDSTSFKNFNTAMKNEKYFLMKLFKKLRKFSFALAFQKLVAGLYVIYVILNCLNIFDSTISST